MPTASRPSRRSPTGPRSASAIPPRWNARATDARRPQRALAVVVVPLRVAVAAAVAADVVGGVAGVVGDVLGGGLGLGAGAAHVSGDVVAGRLQVRLRRLHVAVGADLAGFVADVVADVLQVLADVAAVVPRTGRAEAEQDNEKGGRTWTHDETL